MPANAHDLACGYYFNNNSSNKKNEDFSAKSYNNNNIQKKNDTGELINQKMELYKAKPQYLNTYSLAGPANTCGTSLIRATSSNSQNLNSESSTSKALLKNLLEGSKIKKIGTGLYNLGNNCYLNATLQCMAYTPSLSQWLLNRPHSPVCKIKPLKGFCSLCEVEKIIYDIFNPSCNGICAKPNSLCFNIKKISNVFGVGTQEDASEFFTTLLESMAKSIKFLGPSPTTSKFNILDEIFSFQFRSRITCCNCGRLSDTFENTNSWPVDVKYTTDIRKGMLHFLGEEILDGDNAYKCDQCNRKVRATKKYSIKSAPNVLVINLKRFDFTYAGKLTHFVTYPETLSLKTFITENDIKMGDPNDIEDSNIIRNSTYKLNGVLVHLGYTSHSGHYYSYVRGPNDVWYKADDQQISTVRCQDALDQNAYILFYNRIPTITVTNTVPSTFLSPSIPVKKLNPIINLTNKTSFIQPFSLLKQNNDSVMPSYKNIPESNRFKSTFIEKSNTQSVEKSITQNNNNNNRTLDYDQVLKIKKLNKRKLRLLNHKKKLKELKQKREGLDRNDENDDEVKSLKKRIKKLKKLIKKEKSKIKKLKRYEFCSSDESDDDDDEEEEIDTTNKDSNSKRKLSSEEEGENGEGKEDNYDKKTKTTDGLSLLKQYSSASSGSDEDQNSSKSSSRSSSRCSSWNESPKPINNNSLGASSSKETSNDYRAISESSQNSSNSNNKTSNHDNVSYKTQGDDSLENQNQNNSDNNNYRSKSWNSNYQSYQNNNNNNTNIYYNKFPKKNYNHNNWGKHYNNSYSTNFNNSNYRYNKGFNNNHNNYNRSKSYHHNQHNRF